MAELTDFIEMQVIMTILATPLTLASSRHMDKASTSTRPPRFLHQARHPQYPP